MFHSLERSLSQLYHILKYIFRLFKNIFGDAITSGLIVHRAQVEALVFKEPQGKKHLEFKPILLSHYNRVKPAVLYPVSLSSA